MVLASCITSKNSDQEHVTKNILQTVTAVTAEDDKELSSSHSVSNATTLSSFSYRAQPTSCEPRLSRSSAVEAIMVSVLPMRCRSVGMSKWSSYQGLLMYSTRQYSTSCDISQRTAYYMLFVTVTIRLVILPNLIDTGSVKVSQQHAVSLLSLYFDGHFPGGPG